MALTCALVCCVISCCMNFNASFHINPFYGFDEIPTYEIIKSVDKRVPQYDAKFFETHNLVIALVDQGSSRVDYKVEKTEIKDGELVAYVRRIAPMIQTMDFVSWLVYLEVPTSLGVTSARIELR